MESHKDTGVNALLDTVPKILRHNSLVLGSRIAMRKKRFGIWEQCTWREVFQHVTWICFGFLRLGLRKGDRVIIIGNNDPELFWIEWGVQCAGGIAVCLYVDSLPNEVKYFIEDSGARFFVGEDQEQVDKILAIKDDCPQIKKCIFWEEKGLWFYQEPLLMGLPELEQHGKEEEARYPNRMDSCINETQGDDTSIFWYTSGTTGIPKGIMLSYNMLIFYARNGFRIFNTPPFSEYVSYAPPAWTEQGVGLVVGPDLPMVISFSEEPETIHNDIMEIAPYVLAYPPRLWEDMAREIRVKVEDSSWWKRFLFQLALREGYRRLESREMGKSPSLLRRITWWMADRCVLSVTRGHYGLKRARVCTVGGAACAPELIRFFRALGVPLCNNYGISETGMLTSAIPEDTRYDTVGRPFPGVEVKIEADEILVRSPTVAKGYWRNQESFSKKMKAGYYCTGDAGRIEKDGHLLFYDRIEEMIRLKGGASFSPQFIETRLRFSPYIKDAIAFGDEERPYITIILSIDFGMVSKWAESRKIPYTTLVGLSQNTPVLSLIAEEVRKVNKLLPEDGRLRKFVSLHKEFDPDEAELTRSRKLKRQVMHKKYKDIFQAMYEGRSAVRVEAAVTYRDGRKGVVRATLNINDV